MADPSIFSNYYGNGTDATDTNAYDITQLKYPMDLSDAPEYGGHKVVFFINIAGASQIAVNNPFGGKGIALPASQKSSFAPEAAKQAAGSTISILNPKKRMTTAIALYVPNNLANTYGVNWGTAGNDEMINPFDTALTGFLAAKDAKANEQAPSGSGSGLDKVLAAAKAVGGGIAAEMLNGQSYIQKATGVAPGQSKAQQLFENVNFREFTFSYDFAPKNEAEAGNVLNIIRYFKYHMLPEFFDPSQYLYVYPSEFEVKYYKGDKENQYLERQYTCVLTNLTVNYTPNGQFMTFSNGMPTHIKLDLSFKELSMPTKESEPIRIPDKPAADTNPQNRH